MSAADPNRQSNPAGKNHREDRYWMEQALALAALGEGNTRPNPQVGCIVVRNGAAVGAGYHRKAGDAHAETIAVQRAGEQARGATLYVNLEPCAHEGHTPPCVDIVIESGIGRVVAALQDPNTLVDGRGFHRLREAGIRVDVGLLQDQAEALNAPFLCWHRQRRPLVTLKAAMSLDGQLAAARGRSKWITDETARRLAHRLRWRHDAVLVGGGTARRDNPRLTVRLPGAVSPRERIVLSQTLDLDPSLTLFQPGAGCGPVRVYTDADATERLGRPDLPATIVPLPRLRPESRELNLQPLLEDLAQRGVQSLLVEGGGKTLAAFVRQGFADRACLFVANKLLGGRGGTPVLDQPVVGSPDGGWRLEPTLMLPLGPQWMICGELRGPGAGSVLEAHQGTP